MRALIDADILVYEAGMSAETLEKQLGSFISWDSVENMIESSIQNIIEAAGANDFTLFLSTDNNFRYDLAKTKPYKGNRKHGARPFHYENIRAYLPSRWPTVICDGYEADDGMAMHQYERLDKKDTIICSRDKDLWIVPGWHYTWGRGGQPEAGPTWVDELGWLSLSQRRVESSNPEKRPYTVYKCRGAGLKFFYAQCLMGDVADNIPGLRGYADKAAYEMINSCNSEKECHEVVLQGYITYTGDEQKAKEFLQEQAQLLWMVRERHEDGSLKMWEAPV